MKRKKKKWRKQIKSLSLSPWAQMRVYVRSWLKCLGQKTNGPKCLAPPSIFQSRVPIPKLSFWGTSLILCLDITFSFPITSLCPQLSWFPDSCLKKDDPFLNVQFEFKLSGALQRNVWGSWNTFNWGLEYTHALVIKLVL